MGVNGSPGAHPHELGHVLGLEHNDSGSSVMNTSLNITLYGDPLPVDMANLKALYGIA